MSLGTITPVAAQSVNNSKAAFMDAVGIVGDDSYPTGGSTGLDALLQAELGPEARNVIGVIPGDCGGFVPVYDPANGGTLKVYRAGGTNAALEEVPNATNLSGTTFNLIVVSK